MQDFPQKSYNISDLLLSIKDQKIFIFYFHPHSMSLYSRHIAIGIYSQLKIDLNHFRDFRFLNLLAEKLKKFFKIFQSIKICFSNIPSLSFLRRHHTFDELTFLNTWNGSHLFWAYCIKKIVMKTNFIDVNKYVIKWYHNTTLLFGTEKFNKKKKVKINKYEEAHGFVCWKFAALK